MKKLYDMFSVEGYVLETKPYYLENGKLIAVTNRDELITKELFYKRDDVINKLKIYEVYEVAKFYENLANTKKTKNI